jgi:hypothetical protein
MLANPIVWIIAGVIALIGGIAYLIMKIDGWRATWDNLIKFLKMTWDIFRAGFNLGWLRIEDTFLTGIETLMRAWYKLQALWDKEGAKAGLTAMENRQNERAEQIAASYGKLQDLIDQRGKIDVFQLKWNDKKLSDITGNLKRKFGIGELSPSSVVSTSDIPTSFAPTNVVTENVTNTITGGGRQMKNITFNIGSLVGENTNNFLPGEGPEDADDFMRKLTNALQLVMNDDPKDKAIRKGLNTVGVVKKIKPGTLFNPMESLYRQGIGSLAYRDSWNLFDQIILTPALIGDDKSTYTFYRAGVFNKPWLIQKEGAFKGYPWRTFAGGVYLGGYSDHFPVYIYLIKEKE